VWRCLLRTLAAHHKSLPNAAPVISSHLNVDVVSRQVDDVSAIVSEVYSVTVTLVADRFVVEFPRGD